MLARFASPAPPPASFSAPELAAVRHCFADGLGAEAVLARCDAAAADPRAASFGLLRGAAAAVRRGSPTSVRLSLELLRRGEGLPLADCLAMELRVAFRLLARGGKDGGKDGGGGADFYEGVRALLIDKDGAPRWSPAALGDVRDEDVAAAFAPLEPDEELFPEGRGKPWECCI